MNLSSRINVQERSRQHKLLVALSVVNGRRRVLTYEVLGIIMNKRSRSGNPAVDRQPCVFLAIMSEDEDTSPADHHPTQHKQSSRRMSEWLPENQNRIYCAACRAVLCVIHLTRDGTCHGRASDTLMTRWLEALSGVRTMSGGSAKDVRHRRKIRS